MSSRKTDLQPTTDYPDTTGSRWLVVWVQCVPSACWPALCWQYVSDGLYYGQYSSVHLPADSCRTLYATLALCRGAQVRDDEVWIQV